MSASTTISEEASASSETRADDGSSPKLLLSSLSSHNTQMPELKPKKKRNKPGNPDPNAEVVALSPRTLMATNRYACDVCGRGFQREQNLQLHRRGHSLPWKLRLSDGGAVRKKVYVCPEATCAHHHPSRALGDLTGIKKHFWRKHGEKRWTCERCSKKYAVMSDWKAHVKTCGTREYRCDCGTVFSRKDSFATHRAFCDALAEESARIAAAAAATSVVDTAYGIPLVQEQQHRTGHELSFSSWDPFQNPNPSPIRTPLLHVRAEDPPFPRHNFVLGSIPAATTLHLSAGTALLHTSATASLPETTSLSITCTTTTTTFSAGVARFGVGDVSSWQRRSDCGLLTRDFLGKAGEGEEDLLSLTNSTGLSGSLDFMASPAAASCGCLGQPPSSLPRQSQRHRKGWDSATNAPRPVLLPPRDGGDCYNKHAFSKP
ncbi:hypothetical protein Taro_049040 [Colocasia esculenta]|uniref:C2H2-type domain-containing protein n=1 Tax=Colocasia esculenta TaxID=4460 RepID=A0A843X9X2_COLES|nr:hypothetical protein [Colocasia esculenta]